MDQNTRAREHGAYLTRQIEARRAAMRASRAARPVFVCPDHLLGWVPMGGAA